MKLKCTALGSYVMTAKPSQRGNDDSEVLKFKDFQRPLTSNSKTFKALFHFRGLSRSWKNEKKIKDFQELSRPCGHPGLLLVCTQISTSSMLYVQLPLTTVKVMQSCNFTYLLMCKVTQKLVNGSEPNFHSHLGRAKNRKKLSMLTHF